jgi:hypothetical protein
MESSLTPQMVRDYVNAQGAYCPFCRSSEIEAGKVEADAASAWSRVTCNECGKEWQDVFFLGAVDIIDANGMYGDTVMPAPEDPDTSAMSDPPTPPPADIPAG